MVTPLHARDELDVDGLERLIDHILKGGVSGLFLLGTTGEGPSLSYRVRREVVQRACEQVKGRVPVLVAITDTAFGESINLAKYAAEAGADALVVAAPYYLPPGQSELAGYLERLALELPLPLFLYNFPALTKVEMRRDVLVRAMQNPRIIGLKDSSADLACLHEALSLVKSCQPDWTLLVGPEERLKDAVMLGAHGGIPGGANLFPRLYAKLVEATLAGDMPARDSLQALVMRVSNSLYHFDPGSPGVIKGIKCALKCMGICDDFMAEPFLRFEDDAREKVRQQAAALAKAIDLVLAQPASPIRISGPRLCQRLSRP